MTKVELLKKTLEVNKEKYINHLKDLVAIDTHDIGHGIDGGLEKEGQEYLIKLLKDMGADVKTDPLNEECIKECLDKYSEGNLGHNLDDRFNVYADFKGVSSGKSLMFNGHIDVMPANDVEKWFSHPFKPEIRDGKLYGRGTADMKSGLMAAVMAVQLIKDSGLSFDGTVKICSVCDEEGGGNGSIQAVMNGQKADCVIVCEGTSDELILAHMGFVFFRVEVEGSACHSGNKKCGVSAIDKTLKIINALNEKEHEWLLKYKHDKLPAPNLNIGVIKGGNAGSTVSGNCMFETCIHYLPGQMSHKQVVDEFSEVIHRVCLSDSWLEYHRPVVTMYQAGGGFLMNEDDESVECFTDTYEEIRNKKLNIVGSPAGCDSRLWRNIAECPTLQFGPGNLEQCHAVDEWVSIDDYLNCILIYADFILNFCK